MCLARKLQEKWALNCGGGRRGSWLAVGVLFTYASVFSIVRRANAQTEQRKRGVKGEKRGWGARSVAVCGLLLFSPFFF